MSDSLDGGLGHASDPGSIDGQAFGVEKTSTVVNGTANTKKNAKAAKNQSRQSSQTTTAAEDKPKYSWSEHVWSKFIFSISLVSIYKKSVRQKVILFKIVTSDKIMKASNLRGKIGKMAPVTLLSLVSRSTMYLVSKMYLTLISRSTCFPLNYTPIPEEWERKYHLAF